MSAMGRSVHRLLALALAAGAALLDLQPRPGGWLLPAAAAEDEAWQKEFAEICSKTQDAMVYTDVELRTLVQRCDSLKPAIEKLDPPLRKVYSRRLQGCRDLFQFVIDSREAGAAATK